jgi:sugar/nucleoside kinase (ribokinase family)
VPDYDLVVLGDANPDLVLRGDVDPAFGQAERLVDDATLTVGGSGAITACGAARLGLRVAFCGVVGDDVFGRFLRDELVARGIDVRALRVDADRPTGVTVVLSKGQDRAILTALGTIASLDAADVDPALLRDARHVHVSAAFLQTALLPGLAGLFDVVHAAGATTSIDPNWDPTERWDGGLSDVLPRTDVFLPNDAEVTRIAGVDDVNEAARRLAEVVGVVVVKMGAEGAFAVHADAEPVRVTGRAVEAIDTTGAGDSFDAGFLAASLEGRPLADAVAFAAACGALSTRASGGVDAQPTRDEADAFWREGVPA